MNRFTKKLAVFVLAVTGAAAFGGGLSACTARNNNPAELPTISSTERKEAPADGSTPLDHSALDNVAYMSYVLDNQQYYHSYARNATRSSAVEQVTQTWKEFKSAETSGIGQSVMLCSDISYSVFVRSATQSCFVGDSAYMRTGGRPSQRSTPADINWSQEQPTYYDRQSYLGKYGEFSTELSVYVISESTVISAGNAVDNGDGTYSQTYKLNGDAASYYSYGMMTRGGLKTLPEFESIEITFTFDSAWRVLSSYCEEKAVIAPSALGGRNMDSVSRTETVFEYGEDRFDDAHYAYFDGYFRQYVGASLNGGSSDGQISVIDLLGNGFSGVVDPDGDGQQFALYLTLGDKSYSGKVYAKLADMEDILGSLDVRLELSRDGSTQDFYAEFSGGAVNAYYSEDFAVTADIGRVTDSVNRISEWINALGAGGAQPQAAAETEDGSESGGFDLNSLLSSLELVTSDGSASIRLKTDDLLGTGIGLNVQINFDIEKDENGTAYSFDSLYINSVTYNSAHIELSGTVVPDSSAKIFRNPSQSAADVADYIDGVHALLDSNTYTVNLNLDGKDAGFEFLRDIKLAAEARVKAENGFNKISVNLPVSVSYKGLDVKLTAYYTVNLADGNYGLIYLNLTEICGKAVDAKACCNISEAVNAVTELIETVTSSEAGGDGGISVQSAETAGAAEIINTVIGLDFGKIIGDLAADRDRISLSLNVDEILSVLGVDAGFQLGNVRLAVNLINGRASLSGEVPAVGLALGISGSDDDLETPDFSDYADITQYIEAVNKLIDGGKYALNLSLDGEKTGIEYLDGLTLNASVAAETDGGFDKIKLYVPLEVSYNGLSLSLEAYYSVDVSGGGYGDVYLTLNEINGVEYSAKARADISGLSDAIQRLIAAIGVSDEAGLEAYQDTQTVSEIIDTVLNVDFASVIKLLTVNASGLDLSLDADEVLKAAGVDLGSVSDALKNLKLGTLSIGLGLDDGGNIVLGGNVEGLGLTVSLGAGANGVSMPDDTENYLDLVGLAELVEAAYGQADAIIKAEDITFSLDAAVTMDGVAMTVNGDGEVIWKNGKIRVAVSAELTIADTLNGGGKDKLSVNLIYDETAETSPLVRMTVNGLGLEIYRKDIDVTESGVNGIAAVIGNLINSFGSDPSDGEEVTSVPAAAKARAAADNGGKTLTALNGALKLLQNLEIKLSDDYKRLIINYASDGSLTLGADGGLTLKLGISNGSIKVADVSAGVAAGSGQKLTELNLELSGEEYTFYTDENSFVKAVYNYVSAVLDGLSVENVLGGRTYSVEVTLNGSESGIAALNGINVSATLNYAEVAGTETEKGAKLAEAYLNLDINGTAVIAEAHMLGKDIYIRLDEIGGTKLTDIAFKADADNVYGAAETLVGLITSKQLAKILALIAPSGNEQQISALSLTNERAAKASLTDTVTNILSLDFAQLVKKGKLESGENTLTLSPDALLQAFGTDIRIGEIYLQANPVTHAIYASVANGGEKWLTLNAEAVVLDTTFDKEGYIDIAFVETLISDVAVTLTDTAENENGEPIVLYSFTGSVSANVRLISIYNLNININNIVLTLGLDENDEFYFTFAGDLGRETALGMTVTEARRISVTYSGGYITMGRDVGADGEAYKVMTVSYLIDNILNKTNSPLRWMLGTADRLWGIICDNVPLPDNFGSGLTNTERFNLFEALYASPEEELPETPEEPATEQGFALSDYIKGMGVRLGGYSSVYGDPSAAVSGLGLTDNYYAFNLDLSKLIGDILNNVYAAVIREADGGLRGLKAYADLSESVAEIRVNVNLDGGLTKNHALDYYKKVTSENTIDYDYFKNYSDRVFGCYTTDANGGSYSASEINKPCLLTVIGTDGEQIYSRTLNSGSTVRVLEEEYWLDEEQTRKLIYVDANGNDLGLTFTISSDITIYQTIVGNKTINFFNTDGTPNAESVSLSVGAALPAGADISGYSFAGWYTEAELENAVTNVPFGTEQEISVYAKYVQTEVTLSNGVRYTFVYENGGYYTVTGFNRNAADKDYTSAENTLYIAAEVNGYAVTKIGNSAFKYSNTNAYLKNVVVPATVTEIEAQAFMDIYNLSTVVLLGDVVHLGGNSYSGDNRYVFFGCSEGSDGVTSVLKLYYNNITAEDDENWNGLRQRQEGGFLGMGATTVTYKYELGRHLFPAGTWAYVNYEVAGDGGFTAQQFNLSSYLTTSENYGYENTESDVKTAINEATAPLGFINGYEVSVSRNYSLSGEITLTVTITALGESERWYGVSAYGTLGGNAESVTLGGSMLTQFGGAYFAQAGSEIELRPVAGYIFSSYECGTQLNASLDENGYYVFEMPAQSIEVSVEYAKKPISEITLVSAVDWTYGGEHSTDANGNKTVTLSGEGAVLGEASAEGYAFLGWAYDFDSNGSLQFAPASFTASEVKSDVYYAVWAVAREDADFAVNISGNLPNVNSVSGGSFYNWYAADDVNFEAPYVTALTVDATVLRARMQYTFTYNLNGNGDTYFYVNSSLEDSALNKNNATSNGNSYQGSLRVLEGVEISVSFVNDSHTVIITAGSETVNIRAKRRGGWSLIGSNSYRAEELRTFTPGTFSGGESNSVKVSGDLSYTATF